MASTCTQCSRTSQASALTLALSWHTLLSRCQCCAEFNPKPKPNLLCGDFFLKVSYRFTGQKGHSIIVDSSGWVTVSNYLRALHILYTWSNLQKNSASPWTFPDTLCYELKQKWTHFILHVMNLIMIPNRLWEIIFIHNLHKKWLLFKHYSCCCKSL